MRRERLEAKRHLGIARGTLAAANRGLANRVRALYEEGEIDPFAVLLGAASFDDALTRLDHVDRMAALDRRIAGEAARAGRRLARLSQELAAREAELGRLRDEAEAAAASLEQTRVDRAAYIEQLAAERRLTESEISSLEDQAVAAEEQAEEAAAAAATSAPPAAAPVAAPEEAAAPAAPAASGTQMTVVSTAYALTGTTATGIPVGPGIVAVDPSVIPLGTRMTIPGYGEGVAADTGGAIIGARIDVWVPTEAQAVQWGIRTVTITLH